MAPGTWKCNLRRIPQKRNCSNKWESIFDSAQNGVESTVLTDDVKCRGARSRDAADARPKPIPKITNGIMSVTQRHND